MTMVMVIMTMMIVITIIIIVTWVGNGRRACIGNPLASLLTCTCLFIFFTRFRICLNVNVSGIRMHCMMNLSLYILIWNTTFSLSRPLGLPCLPASLQPGLLHLLGLQLLHQPPPLPTGVVACDGVLDVQTNLLCSSSLTFQWISDHDSWCLDD